MNKYLSAPGTRNRSYFTPRTLPADLENVELPLIIVEGEKKALSLFYRVDLIPRSKSSPSNRRPAKASSGQEAQVLRSISLGTCR